MKNKISILLALIVALAVTVSAFAASITVFSDAGVAQVYGPIPSYAPLSDSAWAARAPVSAVLTWPHNSWPLMTPDWISNTKDNTIPGDSWRRFSETDYLCTEATNISGTIRSAADNAEEVYVNGSLIGSYGTVQGPFIQGTPPEWSTLKSYSFGPISGPIKGTTPDKDDYLPIDFIVRNGAVSGITDPTKNPTGLIFDVTINYTCPGSTITRQIYAVSDKAVLVYGPLTTYTSLNDPKWGSSPVGSVLTSIAGGWYKPPTSSAKWISNTYYVGDLAKLDPTVFDPINKDSWRKFTWNVCLSQTSLPTNISGAIRVAADNAEEVYINGVLVGSEGTVQGTFVDHQQWSRFTVYNYSVPPLFDAGNTPYLQFDFIIRNGPGVWPTPPPAGFVYSPQKNPTGLIFDTTVENAAVSPCNVTGAAGLHLRKVVINDDGGTATTADFTLKADGTGSNDLSGKSPVDNIYLQPDTWTLSESGPALAGYTASAWSCVGGTQNGSSITVGPGQSATCTITNDDLPSPATLHLRKVVINDDDGTATPADFTLMADGTGSNDLSGTSPVDSGAKLKADTFVLSETSLPNYAASAWSCVGGTQNGSSITLGAGQEATCTITNDDIAPPRLHLRKVVVNDNGGTAKSADFTLKADGTLANNDISGPSPVDSGVKPDAFALSESGPAGYTAGSWSCVGGTQNGSNITIGAADKDVTCTITNNDIAPKLHLRKVVINNNDGSATVADFTLKADGNGSNDLSGTSPVDSGATLQAGTFTLSESGPVNYAASAWSCVGGTQNGSSITVGFGQDVTCTITNDDIAPPRLHLRKIVVNDNGGTATTAAFTLKADGTGSNDLSGTSPVDSGVKPDTFVLSESGPAGYAAGAWSCVGGTQNGSSITIGAADKDVTCTITNNDIAPKLHLRKIVVNDNGGTATLANFTLKADGTGSNDLSGASPVDSGATLKADTFALSESGPAGYTASAWSCGGGTQNGSNVTVGIGQEATCTITNDDIAAPKLHLRKVVINDSGGTATTADFTLMANGSGSNDLSGTNPVDSGAGLKPDTFALSESGPAGYAASAWSCVGGSQNGSSITLTAGQEATCTITNNDIAPKLHLRKVVVNDNGGTATVADFTLKADGTGSNDISGTSPVDSGAGLKPDTFALSESGPANYAASAWSCVGGSQNGSNITVGIGQEATCTITNNDIAPKLHLRKVVVNDSGGTATVTNFTLKADGTGSNDLSGTSPVDSGPGLMPDTWTLSESGPAGYAASTWSCVGGTQNGSSISLGLGQEATCTITNNDINPKLHLRKIVINDNGGTATTANFTLMANGSGSNDLSGTSPVDSGAGLKADTFALSESGSAGYAASAWSCVGGTQNGSNITVGVGQDVTCTITNNDIAPKLRLRKNVVNDNGGMATTADFTLIADGNGSNDLSGTSPVDSGASLMPDTWTLAETGMYGYSASAWSCVGGSQNGNSISLGVGQEATCTITNDDQPGTLIIQKITSGANGSFSFATTGSGYTGFSLSGGQQNSQTLDAGSYTVQEVVPLGWELIQNDCTTTGSGGSTGVGDLNTQTATVDLRNGDTVICVFENSSSGAGITRTQGFWSTHPQLAETVWFGGSALGHTLPGVGDNMLCGRPIDTLGKLMGGFWSGVSKTSTGDNRSSLDQARMQLLQQLLAAELNGAAFGTLPGDGSVAAWESAYCGTDQNKILTTLQQAGSFNTSGDSLAFSPGSPADSKTAKAIATLTWWDILP